MDRSVIAKQQVNGSPQLHHLRRWAIKMSLRLQQLDKPGVYPVVLVVNSDGSRELIVGDCKQEFLGN